jgi:uncharacterized protein
VGARQVADLIRRLGLIQLDSVNVFVRSHYMPIFSRLGPYDRAILDELAAHLGPRGTRGRRFFEYWGHEASLIPVETEPLLRWRMARVDDLAWGSVVAINVERPELVDDVLRLVSAEGPLRANQTGVRKPPRPGQMWNWHPGKRALEHLFYCGLVSSAGRSNFERHYDLPDRVLPASVLSLPTPSPADAQRELVRISARALGVATEPDLGDYFRLPRSDSKARVAELVSAGELVPVAVDGWRAPAYMWHRAVVPRRVSARALLTPFDSLVWYRDRTERLFDFTYRIEIYTPAAKRVYGYYVLPFLLGDTLVARVDLKSDRAAGVLLVQGAFAEEGVDRERVAAELAEELRVVAAWLGLDGGVVVRRRGDLAAELAHAVG